MLHSICQQIWKTQQWPQDWKRSVFIPIPKKREGKSFSRVWLFMTPWATAYQAPPSMGFSGQDYWSGVPLPSPKKGNAKECSNYHTIALVSHASKVMLKILKVSFNSTWTKNFQMFKLDLEKAEEPEIKLPTPVDHRKSKKIPEKHLLHWLS